MHPRVGQIEPVVQALLTEHYNPVYVQSMERNFKQYASAQTLAPSGCSAEAMLALADGLVAKADWLLRRATTSIGALSPPLCLAIVVARSLRCRKHGLDLAYACHKPR